MYGIAAIETGVGNGAAELCSMTLQRFAGGFSVSHSGSYPDSATLWELNYYVLN